MDSQSSKNRSRRGNDKNTEQGRYEILMEIVDYSDVERASKEVQADI